VAKTESEPRFVLYSRDECGLCETMLRQLQGLPAAAGIAIDVVDVDRDARTRERFGHKIPVLLLGGEVVCHGRLDAEEVDKALAVLRSPV